MNIHVGKRVLVVAAVLGAVAIFATGFFVALGVRSVVAGPDSAPLAQLPNPGHTYDQIELPPGTWTGLDADTLDGLNSDEIDDADDHVSNADFATNAGTASNAGYATNATTASYATQAGSAGTANTAQSATSAGYASNADMLDGLHADQIHGDLTCDYWSACSSTVPSGEATVTVSVPSGWTMTGGGCYSDKTVGPGGRVITANHPWHSSNWYCETWNLVDWASGRACAYVVGCKVQ